MTDTVDAATPCHAPNTTDAPTGVVSVKMETVRAGADGRDVVEVSVPGTDYRLTLVLDGPRPAVEVPAGRRLRGTIHAEALRIHPATGGGRFIEPVWGAPRSVAGVVRYVDEPGNRVLVDLGAQAWVTPPADQDWSAIRGGGLVNMYLESGTSFRPA